jgi:hypothetical protein
MLGNLVARPVESRRAELDILRPLPRGPTACQRPLMPKSGRCRAVTDDAVVVYRGWYG